MLSTALFLGRNGYRARNGEDGRYIVASAQGVKLIRESSKNNTFLADKTRSILNSMGKIAEKDKVFNIVSKGVKIASDNVNSIIALLSLFNVITAEDKQTEFIKESGNVGGMLLCEGWMSKNLDKYLQKLPINKKFMPIVRGVAFVTGSISASTLGYKLMTKVADSVKSNNDEYKVQEKENISDMVKKSCAKKINYRA